MSDIIYFSFRGISSVGGGCSSSSSSSGSSSNITEILHQFKQFRYHYFHVSSIIADCTQCTVFATELWHEDVKAILFHNETVDYCGYKFYTSVSYLCLQLTVTVQHKQMFVQLCRCIVLYVYCCYCYSDQ